MSETTHKKQLKPAKEVPVAKAETVENPEYADFWMRLLAHLIDGAVWAIPYYIVAGIINLVLYFIIMAIANASYEMAAFLAVISAIISALLFYILPPFVAVFYRAKLESSRWQATVGKRALGLIVTDMYGDKLTFSQSIKRAFAKLLSDMTLGIGYLVMLGHPYNQTMHDQIAKTVVLKGRR